MLDLVWLIPALPLVGFAVLVFAGKRMGEPAAGWFGTTMMLGAFAAACTVFAGLIGTEGDRVFVQTLFTWIPAGDLSVDVGFYVDPLSMTMVLFVTGIGALIHLYSIGYMHGDPRFARFFTYLNLFAAAMLVLVLGDNLLLTFLGWEGVGTCSYLLISFWFEKPANATAGKKAFVTNRVGDWGFMVAMFFVFFAFGSLSYAEILPQAPGLAQTTATAIAVLLVVGAVGKSAQIPLYLWLPDAMAGPTPVSALIHAATMVTAGVYLLIRMNPVIGAAADWVPFLIALIGAVTALVAATIATSQYDIKKVLAYSTISQLGYMFLAVGSGAYVAAIFHMITHAFFKALLFLGAGSVIHGMDDEQDIRRMGGLRHFMPITCLTFIAGWLAISGIPPFSGFWSKDEILAFALQEHPVLYVIGLITAGLTAYYMSREVFLVFYGRPRWSQTALDEVPETAETAETADDAAPAPPSPPADGATAGRPELVPHESPWVMTLPLGILALLAVVGGGLNLPFGHSVEFLHNWLAPVVAGTETELEASGVTLAVGALVSVAICVVGIGAAGAVYLQRRIDPAKVEPEVAQRAWYYDETVAAFVSGPGTAAFEGIATLDRVAIDGAVNGVGATTRRGGQLLRHLQSGYLRAYALGITIGTLLVVAWMLTRVVSLG